MTSVAGGQENGRFKNLNEGTENRGLRAQGMHRKGNKVCNKVYSIETAEFIPINKI